MGKKSVKFPCSFISGPPISSLKNERRLHRGFPLPKNPTYQFNTNAIFYNFLLSVSSYPINYTIMKKILLTTKIKSGILVIEQKKCFPAGLGIKKYINLNRKKTRFQKNNNK